jgi:hypothetical protein
MPKKGNGWPGKGSSLKGGRKGSTRGRSSLSGRFVKKSHAKKHPKTTEIERVKNRGK